LTNKFITCSISTLHENKISTNKIPSQSVSKTVQKGQFRSGVAARLAGVPVETLRVWERRYGITGKSPGLGAHRLYGQEDIDRLALLKRLVDLGQSIGTIAHLDMPALETIQTSLIAMSKAARKNAADQPIQIALIGSVLGSAVFKEALESEHLRVTVQATSLSQFESVGAAAGFDALFIEVPTLLDNTAEEIRQSAELFGIKRIVLFYRFAPNALIRKLRMRGYSVVRMPFDAQEVVMLCSALLDQEIRSEIEAVDQPVDADASDPKFSTETLMRLTQVKSGVYCECPSQLADLLISITAFERYSAQCASQTPEDAALHKRLESSAAKARKIIETAITEVIRHEKILL
jgi:MerR family transcriptional regulator, light-induced transcriptional regulator